MTVDRIQEVLDVARSNYDALAGLADTVALLDMCHCFADNVASSPHPWCRPSITTGHTLTIRQGRYPTQVQASRLAVGTDAFVPNDTYAPAEKNFTVITGINGSGKSTYLKQVALIAILAHVGCYVPAEQAIVPVCYAIPEVHCDSAHSSPIFQIRDRIATRLGTGDDQGKYCCHTALSSLDLTQHRAQHFDLHDGNERSRSVVQAGDCQILDSN